MASVYIGRLEGPAGFSKIVAIKRLHPHLSSVHGLSPILRDEARLASRVRHPNVVPILDVVLQDGELIIVMEYVHGESLSRLLSASPKTSQRVPPAIASAIAVGVLEGLHAAHEA